MPTRAAPTVLMKCAAVLLAFSASADALSCPSSASSCNRLLDTSSLLSLEDIFSSHRWSDRQQHHHHGHGRGAHAHQHHQHQRQHHDKSSTKSSHPTPSSPPASPAPASARTLLTAADLFNAELLGGLATDFVWTTTAPAFQVRELATSYELEVHLPGVRSETISIAVAPQAGREHDRLRVLSLTAERPATSAGRERPSYAREWVLAADVDEAGSIEATYVGDGVLVVKAPKLPAAEPSVVPVQIRKESEHESEAEGAALSADKGAKPPAAEAASETKPVGAPTGAATGAEVVTTASVADKAVQAVQASPKSTTSTTSTTTATATKTTTATTDITGATATTATTDATGTTGTTGEVARELEDDEPIESLDALLNVEVKKLEKQVRDLKAKAKARVDAREFNSRRKEAVGKNKIEWAVEVEAASQADADAAAAASSELDAHGDEVHDLDQDDVDEEEEGHWRYDTRYSHPGQPL